jgi:hypothetical protein
MKIAESNKKRSKSAIIRVAELEREVANLALAVRVSQTLLKQFMEQLRPMQDDLTRFYAALNDVQYKNTALISSVPGVSRENVATLADQLKLADWQESSDKDDAVRDLVPADQVTSENDVIVITSTTPDEPEDRGIFRSKSVLKDIANQDIATGFLNQPVGSTLETTINGARHVVQLLAVRVQKPAAITAE